MRSGEKHQTRTEVRGSADTEKWYVGVCSCGWISEPQKTEARAENECCDHEVYAVWK